MEELVIDFSPALIHLISKIILVFFLGAYVLFSVLIARQITIMNKVLTTSGAGFVQLLGLVHMLIAIGVLVLVVLFF